LPLTPAGYRQGVSGMNEPKEKKKKIDGKYLDDPKFPGVSWSALEPYRNNWQLFR
jgi:hypothetical protein